MPSKDGDWRDFESARGRQVVSVVSDSRATGPLGSPSGTLEAPKGTPQHLTRALPSSTAHTIEAQVKYNTLGTAKDTLPDRRDCAGLTSSSRHDDGTRAAGSGIQYADSCVMPRSPRSVEVRRRGDRRQNPKTNITLTGLSYVLWGYDDRGLFEVLSSLPLSR